MSNARSYRDLHEHIDALNEAGLLHVIDKPVNKDTRMHPLVRWQMRRKLDEPQTPMDAVGDEDE
jgi:hypothetical protein